MSREIELINEKVNAMHVQLTKMSTEYERYVKRMSSEEFVVDETDEIDNEIVRAESLLDRFQEMYHRNKFVMKNCTELVSSLQSMKELLEKFIHEREIEGNAIGLKNNNLIDLLGSLSNKKMNIILAPLMKEIEKISNQFQQQKNGWEEFRIDTTEFVENEKLDEKIEALNNSLTGDEIKQLEEWTGMQIEEQVFDTESNDWTQENGMFNEAIVGKEKLVFLITDESGNKFGGFVNEKILLENKWVSDPNAFLFSLKKGSKNNDQNESENHDMKKYDVNDPTKVFYLWKKNSPQMFGFGSSIDVGVYKKGNKQSSWCNQSSEKTFNYQQTQNALINNQNQFAVFTPERVCVFRMN